MGFKAIKEEQEYLSFQIEAPLWSNLKKDKQFKSNLYMSCCKTKAIMKNSSLGLQYFAHHKKGECIHARESMKHMILKKELYEILLNNNYKVEIEKQLLFDDYTVRPDVYLQMNDFNIAFEIQVTSQSIEQMLYRSKKYNNNGIYVIWLNLFNNRTYTYMDFHFNYKNPLIKMYRVDERFLNEIREFSINNLNLFSFIIQNLELSTTKNIDIENKKKLFFYNKDDFYYYINRNTVINGHVMNIDKNWFGYSNTIVRKERDYIQQIEGNYLKGFILINFSFGYYIEKNPNELVIENLNEITSVEEFKSKIKKIAVAEGWEATIGKKHTKEIQSHVYMTKDSVKLLIMIDDVSNNEAIYKYCKQEDMEYIILSNELGYSSSFNHFYQIYRCSDSFKSIDGMKTNKLIFSDWFITNLRLSLEDYPMSLIDEISIDDYVSVNNHTHIIMAREKIKATKNPRLYVENIEGYPVISKAKYNELIIKGEYLHGFKRYELNEVLI